MGLPMVAVGFVCCGPPRRGRHRHVDCDERDWDAGGVPVLGRIGAQAALAYPVICSDGEAVAHGQRHRMPPIRGRSSPNGVRIETTFNEITNQMELTRHGAHTFWGLLTRTATTIAAHTLMRVCLAGQ